MKRILTLVGWMTLLTFAFVAMADTETIDLITWEYKIEGDVACITGVVDRASITGAITIPSILGGCPVTCIGDDACRGLDGGDYYDHSKWEWVENVGVTAIVIPNGITNIGCNAFTECDDLKSISIPTSVLSIGEGAFCFCEDLKTATIPCSVECVPAEMFYGCENLVSVAFTSGLTSRLTDVGESAFAGCSKLRTIALPESIVEIGSCVFSGCFDLSSVTLPSCLTVIGGAAFDYCTNLTSITIPMCVESIGDGAFDGCSNLESIDVDEWNSDYKSVSGVLCSYDGTVLIRCPEGTALTAFEVPEGVQRIEYEAFADCERLTTVIVPSTVTSFGIFAFRNCTRLSSVELREGVTCLGDRVFLDCTGLTSIQIPASLTNIDVSAFDGCTRLAEFKVNNNNPALKSISGILYSKDGTILLRCPMNVGLTTLEIPDGVTTIGMSAFYKCTKLTSVVLPSSVQYIQTSGVFNMAEWYVAHRAFGGCSNLRSLFFKGNEPAVVSISPYDGRQQDGSYWPCCFYGVAAGCTVYASNGTDWATEIPGTWQGLTIIYNGGRCVEALAVQADKQNGDTFSFSTTLALTAQAGCTIYYTLDGGEPDKNSAVYASPIALSETATVKFYAVEDASSNWSPVGSVTLTRVPGESADITVAPSVADGTRFAGEQSVTLTADAGNVIWYTVDGSDPRTSATRQEYSEAIRMTDDTTLKYYAVNGRGDYGPEQTASYYVRLADGGPYEKTIDGLVWRFAITNGEAVVLSAAGASGTVTVPSELGSCPVTVIGKSALREEVELVSITIPACVTNIGYWAFRDCLRLAEVTFLGTRPHVDLGAFMGVPAYAVVSSRAGSVTAVVPTEVNGDVVEVPEGWLDQIAMRHHGDMPAGYNSYEEAFESKFGSDLAKALAKPTGKRDAQGNAMMVWQDFVAGTDPLDEEDVFKATVSLEDGVPVVRWSPELTAAQAAQRVYKTWGKTALGDAKWIDVSELSAASRQEAGYQFFKVSVEMK